LNQQRQTITETRYPIDQTTPHQLVVSKILGALSCHPALRIIQHDGPRPFATPTDALADLRGSCDIAVSLDGSMKYGLVIEAKTTAHSEGGAWKIFKAVREERRNALQFERLVNAAPRWWYLIVRTDKLTAKTHEEHDRNLLDCPAILVDGKQCDQVPEDFIGPLRFGEMLGILSDRLHISSATPIKMSSWAQLTLPMDDVPVVTMNTPLYSKKPEQLERLAPVTPAAPAVVNNTGGWYLLPSESMGEVVKAVDTINVPIDIFAARLTYDEHLALDEVRCALGANPSDLCSINAVRSLFGVAPIGKISTDRRAAWAHAITPMALAVRLIAIRGKRERCGRHGEVFEELYVLHRHNIKWRRNLAALIAMRLIE
jgi:hypothetical protein